MRLVTRKTLARHIRFTPDTLCNWLHDMPGYLDVAVHMNHVAHYTYDDVTRILGATKNFTYVPTAEDLLSRRLVLLTAQEVSIRLGIEINDLYFHVRGGHLATINFGRNVRYEKENVDRYSRAGSNQDFLTRSQVTHVTSFAEKKLYDLVQAGELTTTTDPRSRRRSPISRQSLVTFLQRHLLLREDPQDWINDRLSSNKPLATIPHVARLVGGLALTRELVDQRRLRCIYKPGGHFVLVEPESVEAYVTSLPALTPHEIAHLYGVSRQRVSQWQEAGQLACPVHDHDASVLYRPCMLALLAEFIEPKALQYWYDKRMASEQALLNPRSFAEAMGWQTQQVVEMAERRELIGIRTPAGTWMFAESVLAAVKRKQRKGG